VIINKYLVIVSLPRTMENYIFKKIFINGNTPVRILVTIFERSIEVILLQNENAWKSLVGYLFFFEFHIFLITFVSGA
jgi:hypothetical protein